MNEDQARIRKLRVQVLRLRIIVAVVAVVFILLIVHNYNLRHRGKYMNFSEILGETIYFDADPNVKVAVEENYLKYLNKAYVLIGTYPDCEYYKISANVTRNDFNWAEDFYVGPGRLYYNYYKDGEPQAKVGIDVSEFQKQIDWEKVANTGIKVAIIRIGYRGYGKGKIMPDNLAEQNLKGAIDAGMETGVYFFSGAINKEEGIEEAKYCLKKIKGLDIKQPIVIDTEMIAEDSEARTNNISVEERTDAVVGFCETIEAAGYTPMIYASRDQFIKYLDVDRIGQWEFWLAAYDTPVFPYHTEGYQYSPYGFVDGIPEQVDLDVWMR
ncbi:MAG: glycoside hydrolase family 25 protein [Eubacterium sp.]|nr:glycoside hydrolase family 25 protein [Eubacterium sp.]